MYCFVSSVAEMGVMKFKALDFNQGGGYDLFSGVFTAPISGVYHFDVVAATKGNDTYFHFGLASYPSMTMMIEGQNMREKLDSEQTTTIAGSLLVQKSQQITVMFRGIVNSHSSMWVKDPSGLRHCSFSGFLVGELDGDNK